MPKTKSSHSAIISSWLLNLPEKKYFRQHKDVIFCDACVKHYRWKKNSDLFQHLRSHSHQHAAKRFDARPERQPLINEAQAPPRNEFYLEMAEAFIAADIPWSKLDNLKFRAFLEKYTGKNVPDESTLRKNYMTPVYQNVVQSIREDIANSRVWIAVDETTDAAGRYIANVLVGSLKKDKATTAHLLMSRELDKTNNSTITQLVLNAFGMLWPGHEQDTIVKNFVLFLTDGVPYMVKAGKNLKNMYPNLLHVTCVAHAINLVAEVVREKHEKTDMLIGALKAVFRKAPQRIQKLRSEFPDLPMPPRPVLTRWGTWLDAVEYYAENFAQIKSLVNSFNGSDAKCIQTAQDLFKDATLVSELTYISTNFCFLRKSLAELQTSGMSISETLSIVDTASERLNQANGHKALAISKKMDSVLTKNSDLQLMRIASKILNGDQTANIQGTILEQFEPSRIASLQYAPLTTVLPERSFSMSKALLTDHRRSMTMKNFEMSLVTHYELSNIA